MEPISVRVPKSAKINGQIFTSAKQQFVFPPENIGKEQKKSLHVFRCPVLRTAEPPAEPPRPGGPRPVQGPRPKHRGIFFTWK